MGRVRVEELAYTLPVVAGTQLKGLLVPDAMEQRQSLDQLKLISHHMEKSPVLNYIDKNLFCLLSFAVGFVVAAVVTCKATSLERVSEMEIGI